MLSQATCTDNYSQKTMLQVTYAYIHIYILSIKDPNNSISRKVASFIIITKFFFYNSKETTQNN